MHMAFGAKVKLTVDTSNKAEFRSQIQGLVDSATKGKPLKITNIEFDISRAKRAEMITKLQNGLKGAEFNISIKEIKADAAISALKKKIRSELSNLYDDNPGIPGADAGSSGKRRGGVGGISVEAEASRKALRSLNNQLQSTYTAINKLGDVESVSELTEKYNELNFRITEAQQSAKSGSVVNVADLAAGVQALRSATSEYSNMEKAARKSEQSAQASEQKRQQLISQTLNLQRQLNNITASNPNLHGASKNRLDSLNKKVNDMLGNPEELSAERIRALVAEVLNLRSIIDETSGSSIALWNKFSGGATKAIDLLKKIGVFQKAVETMRKMVDAIRDIDSAMTELKKVTDLTDAAYDAMYEKSAKIAREIGAAVSDTINSTADFARLGFSPEDSSALAEAALLYKNVGDGVSDISTATQSLISTMKAFKIEAADAMMIVDAFNEVGNNFAISSTGIGDALQKSAAALFAAGSTMEESIGLVAAMNAVIQNPDSVGTTLKTMTMYLRAAKTEAEEAGESTDGMASSVSKLREELKSLTGGKVDIMLNDDEFKSPFEIIEDLSKVWNELTDVNRSNILNLIGGKRNANAISALIENFDDARSAMEAASNSMGSAFSENESYLDSINGRLAKMQATFQNISQNVLSSGLTKFVLSVADGLLQVVNFLSEINLILPTIIASMSVIKGLKAKDGVMNLLAMINSGGDAEKVVEKITAAAKIFTGGQKQMLSSMVAGLNLDNIFSDPDDIVKVKDAIDALSASSNNAAFSLKGLKSVFGGLFTVAKPELIIAAISAVIGIISHFVTKAKEAREAAIEFAHSTVESFDEAQTEYDSNIDRLNSLSTRYYELSRNTSRTAEEQDEYNTLLKEIISISPGIVSSYESETEAIIAQEDALKAAKEAQLELLKTKMSANFARGDEVVDGLTSSYKDALSARAQTMQDTFGSGWFQENVFENLINDAGDAKDKAIEAITDVLLKLNIFNDEAKASMVARGERSFYLDEIDALTLQLDNIIPALSAYGIFSKEVLVDTQQHLYGVAQASNTVSSAIDEMVTFLSQYDKYGRMDGEESWDSQVPAGLKSMANDVMRRVAIDAMVAEASYAESIAMMDAAMSDFVSGNIVNQYKRVEGFAKECASGAESTDKFARGLHFLTLMMDKAGASAAQIESVETYFNNLATCAENTGEAVSNMGVDVSNSVGSMSDALSKANAIAELISKSQADMSSEGRLSAETYAEMENAIKELGLDPTDYFVEVNKYKGGAVIDSWVAPNIEALERLGDTLIKTGDQTGVFGDAFADMLGRIKQTTNLDNATKVLEIIKDAIAEMSEGGGLSYDSVLGISEQLTSMGLNPDDYLKQYEFLLPNGEVVKGVTLFTAALAEQGKQFLENSGAAGVMGDAIAGAYENLNGDPATYDFGDVIGKASNFVNSLSRIYQDAAENKGLSLDGIAGMHDLFGDSWIDYVDVDEMSGKFVLLEDKIKSVALAQAGLTNATKEVQQAFLAGIDAAKAAQDVPESQRITNMLGDLESYRDVVESALSDIEVDPDGFISADTFKNIQNVFGDKWNSVLESVTLEDGTIQYKPMIDEMVSYAEAHLGESGLTGILGGIFAQMFSFIGEEGKTAFDDLTEAMNDAMNIAALAAEVEAEMAKNGKLTLDTVAKIRSTLGEKGATAALWEITKDGEAAYAASGEVILQSAYAVVEGHEAATNGVTAYYEAATNNVDVVSAFEEITSAMSEASSVISATESAMQAAFSGDGLTFDAMSDLMSAFGEDWLNVIQIDEATGQFQVLTDKIKAIGVEQLKSASATDSVVAAFERQFDAAVKAQAESARIANLETRTNAETEGLTQVIAAIKESVSETGVGISAIEKLKDRYSELATDSELSDMFEATAGGIRLNVEAVNELEDRYERIKLKEYESELSDLMSQYDLLSQQIAETNDPDLYAKRDAIIQEIRDVQSLQAQYRGLISSYNKWISAKNGGEAGDKYDSIFANMKDAKDLRKQGLVGTNEFEAAAEFMTGLKASEVGTDALVAAFDEAYPKMQRYFTDGSKGIDRFMNDLRKIEGSGVSKDGNQWFIEGLDVVAMADKLGISVEAFEAILSKVSDYGIEIHFDPVTQDLEKLRTTAESAGNKLKELGLTDYEFNFDTTNVEYLDEQILQAKLLLDQFREGGVVNLDIEGAAEAQEILASLIRQKQKAETPTVMQVDTTNIGGDLGSTLRAVQDVKNASNNLEVAMSIGADTTEAQTELDTALATLQNQNPEVLASLGLPVDASGTLSANVDSVIAGINNMNKQVLINAGVEESAISNFVATEYTAQGKVIWSNDTKAVNTYSYKTQIAYGKVIWNNDTDRVKTKFEATGYVRWNNSDNAGGVDGTAHASGTALSSGYWGARGSGTALMGELGPELIVRNGRFFTVGDNGAGFYNYKKGDIIFNAEQTKQIFEKGKITHGKRRGTAMAYGTALVDGSGTQYWGGGSSTSNSSSSSSGSSGSKKPAKKADTNSIKKLQDQYNKLLDTLEHLIAHQEFLFDQAEIGLDYDGMNASLEEQARLYQEMMQKALEAIDKMKKKGATDDTEALREMEENYWDAYRNFHSVLDEINELYVEGLNNKIDDIQNAYDGLKTAVEEFESAGGISIDTFQELIGNGIQYLSLLDKVNGQYVVNEEGINRMIAAQKEQLAIESALSYIRSLSTALTAGDEHAVQNLVNAGNQISDAAWSTVYAQAAALKNLGLSDKEYAQVLQNIEDLRALANSTIVDVGNGVDDITDKIEEANDAQREALEQILEYTEDLIEFETEQRIEAIEGQIDAYREIIELKKKSIQTSKEESDYEQDVLEKTKALAQLQARIDQLALDDSREAQIERMKLLEEQADLQKELGDMQYDHGLQMSTDALDAMADEYEEKRRAEIEALEDSISSAEKLNQLALQRITDGWGKLREDLLAWNTEFGSSLNSEIIENWNLAADALGRYGSYLEAVNGLSGKAGQNKFANEGSALPKFHTGGVVSGFGPIDKDEVAAILQKGEVVVSKAQTSGLFKIIDFQQTLIDKLGSLKSSFKDLLFSGASEINTAPKQGRDRGSIVFSPTIQVDINHSGALTDSDANVFGKRIAGATIDELYEAFERRGISALSVARVRI